MTYLFLGFLDSMPDRCEDCVHVEPNCGHSTLTSPAEPGTHTPSMNFHCTFETHKQEDVLFPEYTQKNKFQKDPHTAETITPCSFLDLITPPTNPDQDWEAPTTPSLFGQDHSQIPRTGEEIWQPSWLYVYMFSFLFPERKKEIKV